MKLQRILSDPPVNPIKMRLSERCLSYARDNGVPVSLIATLDECAYAESIQIGRLCLSPLAELDLENQFEENRPCAEHGFLIVGSGLNGDPIVLELSSGQMAFISHDLLWERHYQDFEECVVRSPFQFHDFWRAALEDGDFPVDSQGAADAWRSE